MISYIFKSFLFIFGLSSKLLNIRTSSINLVLSLPLLPSQKQTLLCPIFQTFFCCFIRKSLFFHYDSQKKIPFSYINEMKQREWSIKKKMINYSIIRLFVLFFCYFSIKKARNTQIQVFLAYNIIFTPQPPNDSFWNHNL